MSNTSGEDAATILARIGEVVEDAAEETFILFSHNFPSNDLGMLDPKAPCVTIEIAGHEYTIQQSSGLLNSSREAGTTGAMLWKVTPLVGEWLASKASILWSEDILSSTSTIVELGCGIAGLVGLAVSPFVSSYLLTDQEYVMKLLKANLATNLSSLQNTTSMRRANSRRANLHVLPFDWETDSVQNLCQALPDQKSVDLVILCDCIYNIYLIQPLLKTCIDVCRSSTTNQTVLLMAQQLRTDEVFEEWTSALLEHFDVFRVSDTHLPINIRTGSGYAIHLAILKTPTHD